MRQHDATNPPPCAGVIYVMLPSVRHCAHLRSERCMLGVAAQILLCLSDHGVCVVSCAHFTSSAHQDALSTCKKAPA